MKQITEKNILKAIEKTPGMSIYQLMKIGLKMNYLECFTYRFVVYDLDIKLHKEGKILIKEEGNLSKRYIP